MEKHPINDLMTNTLQKIRELVDTSSIVGSPIRVADNITLIPVSKVSFGFASGGSDFQSKRGDSANPFGGGGGAGVKMEPVAFIVIKDGNTRLLSVAAPESSILDKIVDLAPELVDKVTGVMEKKSAEKEAPVQEVIE